MAAATVVRGSFVLAIRALGVHAVLIAALSAVAGQPAAAQAGPRVRSHSARIVAAIARGTGSSPTFRRLVETIDATDGLVFVDEGICRVGVRACLVPTVTVAGPSRVLHILVNLRKAQGCGTVAMIGHELQHAIEVLGHPGIRTDIQVYNFFDLVGRTGAGRFETKAAIQAGLAIESEGCGD
jgi:hypothetical protein